MNDAGADPVGMVGENAAGTRTVMRAPTMRGYADQEGFSRFEILAIENDFYRFYLMARNAYRRRRPRAADPAAPLGESERCSSLIDGALDPERATVSCPPVVPAGEVRPLHCHA